MALPDPGEQQIRIDGAPRSRVLQINNCIITEMLLEEIFKVYKGYKKVWRIGKHRLAEFGNTFQAFQAMQKVKEDKSLQRHKVLQYMPLEVSFAGLHLIEEIELRWYTMLERAMNHVVTTEMVMTYEDCIPHLTRYIGSSWYNKEHVILTELFEELSI